MFTRLRPEGGDSETTVYVADAEGKNLAKVVEGPPIVLGVGWTPDGRVVIAREEENTVNLFTIRHTGGDLVRLTDTPDIAAGAVSFSPNGDEIAFATDDAVYALALDGGEPRLISGASVFSFLSPVWDPTPP